MPAEASVWLRAHGSAGFIIGDSTFTHAVDETGCVVRPGRIQQLRCSVLFPLPSAPWDVREYTSVAVSFSAQAAEIDGVQLMSGNDELWAKMRLEKSQSFVRKIPDGAAKSDGDAMGLALSVQVKFYNMDAQVQFQSVGVQAAGETLAKDQAKAIKFDRGTWDTQSVRNWSNPQVHTSGRVNFTTMFDSKPQVSVGITGLDLKPVSSARVVVYATDIDERGFTAHADTWDDTVLYSCVVSWVAIQV
jgi:hypothetical protein